VRVLVKQHGLSEQPARSLLRGIIVDEEERACRFKGPMLASSPSNNITEHIKAIQLYVGGSCYRHATAPRYRIQNSQKPALNYMHPFSGLLLYVPLLCTGWKHRPTLAFLLADDFFISQITLQIYVKHVVTTIILQENQGLLNVPTHSRTRSHLY